MGSYAALAHTTWVSGYDFTGDTNQTSLDIAYEELDNTVFGSTARSRQAGLETDESMVAGWWDSAASGAVDPEAFTGLGATLQAITQTVSGAEGDVAYLWQAKKFRYQPFGGSVGELIPFELALKGTEGSDTLSVGAVRGRLLKAKGNISSTGVTGTVVEVGAVGAGQYLYCTVHCFAVGTTFTLQIQSDDAQGFPSATTRMTVGPVTTVGGTWGTRVAGPVTDTWWRVNVSAITGTSQVGVAIGIK